MQLDANGPRRLYATIGALIGLAALALRLYLFLAAATAQGRSVPGVLVQFASYFTILTNALGRLRVGASMS